MGKWFARYFLNKGFEIIISGRNEAKLREVKKDLDVSIASNIEAVKQADVIIISVSIDSFEDVVKEISPFVRPAQIVVDITSIKEFPVATMLKYLPDATVLGTHPLFGPGAKDLISQNFVLTPADPRGFDIAEQVKEYLIEKGARVSVMTPREHDEMMAVVLGLAHFISIVAADTLAGIENLPQLKAVGGSTYRVLTTLVESVISEDPDLYATLQMRLPGLAALEDKFQKNAAKWAELVKHSDKPGFARDMAALKQKYTDKNTNFGHAYENMYKIIEWL